MLLLLVAGKQLGPREDPPHPVRHSSRRIWTTVLGRASILVGWGYWNIINFVLPPTATTFDFSSVIILLLWLGVITPRGPKHAVIFFKIWTFYWPFFGPRVCACANIIRWYGRRGETNSGDLSLFFKTLQYILHKQLKFSLKKCIIKINLRYKFSTIY